MSQVIVVGGGLAGVSAAHTVLERGGRVLLLDKMSFLGGISTTSQFQGNSVKATSGINGALTRAQVKKGIPDSPAIFENDTSVSFHGGKEGLPVDPLVTVLTYDSGPAVDWLIDRFGLDLSLVSRLGGHSQPRTHRGGERFPGMTITMALIEKLEDIEKKSKGELARIITKARATKLIKEGETVVGLEYEKDGKTHQAFGPVIIATGGFAADFSPSGILAKVRPDLLKYPTTNGEHCTGDGIKMSMEIGAQSVGLQDVQVHPTGLVHPDEPDAKLKFLAAEALRGVGGLLLDNHGKRFVNELGRRDYVSGEMWKHNKAPYRLVLNSKGGKEIEWHCKHYQGRGLMKFFRNGAELAAEIGNGCTKESLAATFKAYNEGAAANKDAFGKKYFDNMPFDVEDSFWVAVVTPIVHYCMGGLQISAKAEVCSAAGAIPGLYAAGEVAGGVHGINRLGGNSLLDCVVFGRVAGGSAAAYILDKVFSSYLQILREGVSANGAKRVATIARHLEAAPATPAAPALRSITKEEVARHNTEKDCWIIVNGQVLDATTFLPDHPGGKRAILLYAGKDATEEFNMLHKPDIIERYAPQIVIGTLAK